MMVRYLKVLCNLPCTEVEFVNLHPQLQQGTQILEEEDEEDTPTLTAEDTLFILCDSTPKGFEQCARYMESLGPICPMYRYRYPYTCEQYSPGDALLEGMTIETRIWGRVRWHGEARMLSAFQFERIEMDTEVTLSSKTWPIPYEPKFSHIRANGRHGSRAFYHADLLTGMTLVQRYAKDIWIQDTTQSLHEIACRCVSRFDVPISDVLTQLKPMFRGNVSLLHSGWRCPRSGGIDIPYYLLKYPELDAQRLRDWYKALCTEDTPPTPIGELSWVKPTRPLVNLLDGGKLVEFTLLDELLRKWMGAKSKHILVEKRQTLESWSDRNSVAFKERMFIQLLFSPYEAKVYYGMPAEEQRNSLMDAFGYDSDLVDHLMNLPIKRINASVFQDLSYMEMPTNDTDEGRTVGGKLGYGRKTTKELFLEELTKLSPQPQPENHVATLPPI